MWSNDCGRSPVCSAASSAFFNFSDWLAVRLRSELLTVGAGARLEQATNSEVLPTALVAELLARLPSPVNTTTPAGHVR